MASRTAYSTWKPQKPTLFDGHYLRNRSTFDIGVLGYIGIVQHKEHSPEVLSIPPGTPRIRFWWGNLRERDHLGNPGVDERIILRRIFRKWYMGVWTGLNWLRIETFGGHL